MRVVPIEEVFGTLHRSTGRYSSDNYLAEAFAGLASYHSRIGTAICNIHYRFRENDMGYDLHDLQNFIMEVNQAVEDEGIDARCGFLPVEDLEEYDKVVALAYHDDIVALVVSDNYELDTPTGMWFEGSSEKFGSVTSNRRPVLR